MPILLRAVAPLRACNVHSRCLATAELSKAKDLINAKSQTQRTTINIANLCAPDRSKVRAGNESKSKPEHNLFRFYGK